MQQTVKIRRDLRFSVRPGRGEPVYVIEDPARHRFFRIGRREYIFITHLDGTHTLTQALDGSLAVIGKDGLSAQQAERIVNWLAANQLLSLSGSAPMEVTLAQERRLAQRRHLQRLNLITLRLPLLNPSRLIDRLFPWLRWITGGPFFLFWCAATALAVWELGSGWQQFVHQSRGLLAPGNLFWLWVCWFVLKVLHELSHALVCRRYGGQVYEAGILFIVFIPLTYVDATASWKFPSRWQRAHVAAAGMSMDLLAAALAVLCWAWFPAGAIGVMARNVVIVAGVGSILFNANPLMRFDGYYLLCDLTDIANLYAKGLGFVYGWLRFLFLGIRPAPPAELGWRRWFIGVYGVAAYFWRILVLVGLTIAASRLFHGLGLLVALAAVVLWITLPVTDFVRRLPALVRVNPHAGRRLVFIMALVAAAGFFGIFRLSWSERVAAPAVVEYRDQAVVRSATPGFVHRVYVKAGDAVRTGQPLVALRNDELRTELADTRLQIRILETEARLYFNADSISAFQVARERIRVLEQRAAELDGELSSLTLTAPRGGIVVARNLQNLPGAYVRRGQDILWIVSENHKAIRVSVDQEDVDVFRRWTGRQVTVDMRRWGLGVFPGRLVRVDPQASRGIPHPAFSAAWGGPLDVRPGETVAGPNADGPAPYEFFQPRFSAEVEAAGSVLKTLRVGRLARVRIRGNPRRIADIIREYLAAKTGSG
jgi:putative peptide zinc metalloprotease protein